MSVQMEVSRGPQRAVSVALSRGLTRPPALPQGIGDLAEAMREGLSERIRDR